MTLVFLLVLHAVVVCLIAMGCALHAKLAPATAPVTESGTQEGLAVGQVPSQPLSGQVLEEYVTAGLLDFRIMLAQAARRRRE